MFTKLRNSYHNASQWAHHHTAVLVFGLTVLAATFGWQFGSYFIGESKTHASYDPIVWTARCDANEVNYTIDRTECYGLANVYAQLDGPDWNINFWLPDVSWFSSTDINNWHGINVIDDHVDAIQLYGFNNANPGLGQVVNFAGLPYLTNLWLWSTAVSGIDVSTNTLLENLTFRYNLNTTTIDVSANTNLEILDIEGNNITAIDISTLANLKQAYLSYNQISSVDISDNPLLETFNLAMYNGGTVSSIDFSNNPNLTQVYIPGQNLTSVDLSAATGLQSLSVSRNNSLSSLVLHHNAPLVSLQAGGTVLSSLDVSMYPNMQYLKVDGSRLTSLTIGTKTQLNTIDAANNRLTQIDLSGLSNPSSLHYLYLQGNFIADLGLGFDQFTNIGFMSMAGEFADAMNGNCLDPQTLSPTYIAFLNSEFSNWEANQTCGRDVPESEYNALMDLYNATDGDNWINNDGWGEDFSVCDWYGIVCTTSPMMGGTHVTTIQLNNSNLQGYLPASLDQLLYIQQLQFNNWVDDQGIPENPNTIDVDLSVFAGMVNLKEIGLFYSQGEISGTLNDIGLLPLLERLRLDGADISGTIPSFFSDMVYLKDLDFEGTSLEGPIPDLTALVRLEKIDLRDTNVTGPLPEFATQYPVGTTPANMITESPLTEINLNGTMLDGDLPASWGSLSNLQEISVGGRGGSRRYISGELPASWGNLVNLTRLQIMFTNIEGSLPASWGNLVGLERLNLLFNRITGEVPSSWEDLAPQNLLIMGNHLEGQIPAWITNADNYLIQNNCFDIDGIAPALEGVLDQSAARGNMWRVQNNCLSDVVVTKTLSNLNPLPGEQFTLTIGYKNFGPQKAPRFMVSEVIDEDIELITSIPPESQAVVNKEFGIDGDMCYEDMYSIGEGPYAQYLGDFLASILGQTDGDGGGSSLPEGMTTKEFFDMAFYSIILGVEDQQGLDPEQMEQEIQESLTTYRELWDEPTLGTPGVMSAVICDFIQTMGANIQNPVLLKTAYDQISEVCLPALGFDYRAHEDQCGAGGEDGYRWDIGDLAVDEEDEIVLTLRLAQGLNIGTTHNAITYLVLDGENLSNSTIPVTVTAGGSTPPTGPVCGNNIVETGEQCDGGSNCNVNCTLKVTNPVNPGPGPTTNPTPLVVDDCSDYIPPVDQSSSYYDADCEPSEKEPQEEETQEHKAPFDKDDMLPTTEEILAELANIPAGMDVDAERVEAYLMAKNIGMTTMPDFVAFKAGEEVTRAVAAKYFVQYVETVLDRQVDESRRAMCSKFDDIDKLKGQDLHEFVIRACMHKLMGLDQGVTILESFNPYDVVTRAQGAAMTSRVMYGTTYDNTNNQYPTRYYGHIEKLLADEIISDGNPNLIEKRVYPLLMFLRWIKAE